MEEDAELEAIKRRMLRRLMSEASERGRSEVLDRPVEVDDRSLDEFVRRHPIAVIDCWATWCPPCRMLAPVIDELARRYAGRIAFGKLDVDLNPETVRRYSIMEVPTLLVFKRGALVGRIIGFRPLPELDELLRGYLD
ncbi:thiol reductase thioredoxin [Candidatus Geothermarchaeota archaeon ex4572_27]|nr:MAG: thiol reductase thioredoxin [Candidatus Geothermarchaeota archaeon ex4572_27]